MIKSNVASLMEIICNNEEVFYSGMSQLNPVWIAGFKQIQTLL